MKNIITIAKKELRTYFNNPTAYIIILAFLLLWEFLFFRGVFLTGESSLRDLFGILPWIFMVVVPALTMGSLAEEKSEGTLEFLLTHPMNQTELILGKFLGIFSFFALALLFVFPLAFSLNYFGRLDWGMVFGQYAAGIFLTSIFASLGILISSFFTSQISAFLVSAIANFFLVIAGTEFFTNRFSLGLASFLDQLSVSNHFNSMSRGVIETRDVWYFISLTAVFLGFTYLNLIKNKFGNRKEIYRNYQIGLALLLGIAILSNIVGSGIPGRIDLTQEKIYTLSPTTKNIISDLPDIVNISFYASDKLPAQLQPVLRETKDILRDYGLISKGKIKITSKNPSTDEIIANEAASQGIQPMRFNVVSQEELQVKDGYLGINISYGGKNEAIPFVQNINDLEYQLSSLITKLTTDNKPKIGFVSGHGEKNSSQDYGLLTAELKKQFEVVEITAQNSEDKATAKNPPSKTAPTPPAQPKKLVIPDGVKTLIITNPTEDYSDAEKNTLADFMEKGGNTFFMLDGVTISTQTMAATANKNNLIGYLKDKTGVEVKNDLVYDLRSNEQIGLGSGQMRYISPYPFWTRALKTAGNSPITSKLDSVTLPWVSSLEINTGVLEEKGLEKMELFTTTDSAGSASSDYNISPDQKFPSQNLGKKLLAVALTQKQNSDGGRIVIVGDADFLSDQNVQSRPGNFGFGFEAVSWLSQESALSQIKLKNMTDRKFMFKKESDPALIKFGNLAFVFFVTAGYGSWRMLKRKKMKGESYQF